jgi:HK97 family phage portal protein
VIADRFRAALERNAATLSNPTEWLHDALSGGLGLTYSGKRVTPASALGLIPYYSGVQLLAGAVGSSPLMVYRELPPQADGRDDDERQRAKGTDQWRILHDQPNPEMTADQLWEISQALLLTWGNSFHLKERSSLGTIGELWPIAPYRVQVYRSDTGEKRYLIDGGVDGVSLSNAEILHIPGLGGDGLVGYSPIQLARQELASMLALQEFAGTVWANSAVPLGVLTHPNELSKAARKNVRRSWERAHRGGRKFGRPAILEEGLTWQAIGMPLEDAQFIEAQKLGDLRCAQLLRIPPSFIGAEQHRSMTYSNSEMEGIDFVRWCLRRWLTRHENTIRLDPVIFPPRLSLTCEFLIDEILRADSLTRQQTLGIQADHGALTVNEWRRLENRPDVSWGDEDPRLGQKSSPSYPARPGAPPPAPGENGNGAHELGEDYLAGVLERAERR